MGVQNRNLMSNRYQAFVRKDLDRIGTRFGLDPRRILEMKAVAAVLPFRTNSYVLENLIRWHEVPEDPIYQLTFPQPEMLQPGDLARMVQLISSDAPEIEIRGAAREIQRRLNPHPAGQLELNVPRVDGERLSGIQHKYRETVLFFPSQGQTCHAYCTYCFRWPQFVGIRELKFAESDVRVLCNYLAAHREVSSVLFRGGDPLVMKTSTLRRYIEPLLGPEFEHLISIRIGSKAPAYWPDRFVGDADADDLLRLFEEVRGAGKQLALMAHYTHPRELETQAAQRAVGRIVDAGAGVRCQAPLVRAVNDDAETWAELWRREVRVGAVPYYMFVERDTGPKHYFEVPLTRAWQIFRDAYGQVSGLARTVRGPSMSARPGKVRIVGEARISGERVFVLEFIQARDPRWVGRPFFARWDPKASWLTQLRPAFGENTFFYEKDLKRLEEQRQYASTWGRARFGDGALLERNRDERQEDPSVRIREAEEQERKEELHAKAN